jgi:DNA-binding CsgD family transcriptional regulator
MVTNQGISLSCDRCILNLLRFHLMEAEENNPEYCQIQQILTEFKRVFEPLGLLLVTSNGQVRFMTQQAKQLLRQYFLPYGPHSLPEHLQHWFDNQLAQRLSNGNVPSPCLPLLIEQAGRQLCIRIIPDSLGDQYLLQLEERELQSFSMSALELLGLTQREAEVLFWVAKDKSNVGIAKVLGCCEGTVRKHLEHIHTKLGVQTRTAAVMVALERLGLVTGEIVAISS